MGVLFVIALMGVLLAVAGETWHTASQREKERELLYIGDAFRDAIALYYNRTPGTDKKFPRDINELLKDPRYLVAQRYLRKIYIDPMTGSNQWGVIKAPDGGIAGIYSLSEDKPIKLSFFGDKNAGFEKAQKYADWKFIYRARTTVSPAVAKPPPGAPPSAGAVVPPPGAPTPLPKDRPI